MKYLLTSLSLLLTVAACKKSEPAKAAPNPVEPAAATAPAAAPAAPAAPAADVAVKAEYKPDELWAALDGVDHMTMTEKFNRNVTLTGTVKAVKDDPVGEYVVELDAGNGHTIALTFALGSMTDAKKATIKAGGPLTVDKCDPTMPTADREALTDCALR